MVDFAKLLLDRRNGTAATFTAFADPEPEDALTLSFGKHRGVPLTQVETSYLEWVRTADRITPALLTAIDAELATRKPKAPVLDRWRAITGTPKDITDMARLLVATGEGELSAALDDHRVAGAVALLKWCIDMIELESDTGNLPF